MPYKPPWSVTCYPNENGTGVGFVVHNQETPGLQYFLVGRALLEVTRHMLQQPSAVIPTEAEVRAKAAEMDNPAVALYGRDGITLWLGKCAHDAIGPELVKRGWTYTGGPPAGVFVTCQRFGHETDFDAQYLPLAAAPANGTTPP